MINTVNVSYILACLQPVPLLGVSKSDQGSPSLITYMKTYITHPSYTTSLIPVWVSDRLECLTVPHSQGVCLHVCLPFDAVYTLAPDTIVTESFIRHEWPNACLGKCYPMQL